MYSIKFFPEKHVYYYILVNKFSDLKRKYDSTKVFLEKYLDELNSIGYRTSFIKVEGLENSISIEGIVPSKTYNNMFLIDRLVVYSDSNEKYRYDDILLLRREEPYKLVYYTTLRRRGDVDLSVITRPLEKPDEIKRTYFKYREEEIILDINPLAEYVARRIQVPIPLILSDVDIWYDWKIYKLDDSFSRIYGSVIKLVKYNIDVVFTNEFIYHTDEWKKRVDEALDLKLLYYPFRESLFNNLYMKIVFYESSISVIIECCSGRTYDIMLYSGGNSYGIGGVGKQLSRDSSLYSILSAILQWLPIRKVYTSPRLLSRILRKFTEKYIGEVPVMVCFQ